MQVDESKLTDKQKTGLPLTGGCKPIFIFYKVSARAAMIMCRRPMRQRIVPAPNRAPFSPTHFLDCRMAFLLERFKE
jgi:hypothetical protein